MKTTKTVLIVDDNHNNAEMCRIYLEIEGYMVYSAEDGETGLAVAGEIVPDVILLDIVMEGMDGFQMLERLHADPRLKDIPVLVLTVMTDTVNIVKALHLGAIDYLKKPFNADEFVARVNRLVKLKESQDVLKNTTESLKTHHRNLEIALKKWTREVQGVQKILEKTILNVPAETADEFGLAKILNAANQARHVIAACPPIR
jgi:DNA-binding response OmpR family regulator